MTEVVEIRTDVIETVEVLEGVELIERPIVETVEVGSPGPQGPPGPPGGGSGTATKREELTALVDGTQVTFSTAVAFTVRTTRVFLNGLLQEEPTDYVEVGSLDAITFDEPPQVGDRLVVVYEEGS